MDSVKHYKLFKKGKNWCAMAITTAVAIAGITLSVNHVQADTVDSTTQVASTNATNNTANDINQSSIANEQLNSEGTQDLSFNDSKNALNNDENYVDQYDYSQSKVVNPTYQSNYNQNNVTENGWGSDGLYYQNGQVVKNSTINVDDGTYWLDDNGQIAKDHFQEQDGKMYYFGQDGKEYKDRFYQNWGQTYYFGLDGARWDDRFYTNWGHTYYFGDDGARWNDRFYTNWGHTYYFGDDGARWDNRFYQNWGHTYYFGDDGARWDDRFYQNYGHTYYFGDDGARWDNRFYTNWGNTYFVGDDGARWDNTFMSAWGKIYYFGDDGSRVANRTINLGFGNLTFDGDGVLSDSNSFIRSIVNGAIRGWTEHGVLPSLTLSQAIIESGWGRSVLASKYHNLFGIKGSYNGQSVNMPTYENYGYGLVLINDNFRAYPDNDASVEDHANFLVDNSRYSNLLWDSDSNSVTYKIRADGYATATNYTYTLRNAISSYDLTRFDQVAFRAKKANL